MGSLQKKNTPIQEKNILKKPSVFVTIDEKGMWGTFMRTAKQISSLEKIRFDDMLEYDEITHARVLRGERFSYQIAFRDEVQIRAGLKVNSSIFECVKIFFVQNAVMDAPVTMPDGYSDEHYITKEAGLMPDILIPCEERGNMWVPGLGAGANSLWVEVDVPRTLATGEYSINISLLEIDKNELIFEKTMTLSVQEAEILPQELIYTRWFYADCIADAHNVEIYSEAHWALIEKYILEAVDGGMNMILVPIHTPPLDTAIGTYRPCVQLVDITKEGGEYRFSFEKFERFIATAQKCGIKYFEMAHMFSQWGAKCAPGIMVEENKERGYMFGWHTPADGKEYTEFLPKYVAALSRELDALGIAENTYFHISDEPTEANMDAYRRARDMFKPLIGKSKIMDALSDYSFYENGLVEIPVTRVSHMDKFIGKGVSEQWTYYCCHPEGVHINCFMAMPSWRIRMLGILLYKYDIKGFLHWGLNFYNSCISVYKINPYTTTSGAGAFASGDPFILYPSHNGAYNSIRGKLTREAIGDLDLCRTAEKYIGRDGVVALIDSLADMDVTYDKYPGNSDYLLRLREDLIDIISDN